MTTKPMPYDFTRTAAALAIYDEKNQVFIDADISKWSRDRAVEALEAIDKLAEKVGEAFGLDTAAVNNLETCRRHVRPDDVRKAVAEWMERNDEAR